MDWGTSRTGAIQTAQAAVTTLRVPELELCIDAGTRSHTHIPHLHLQSWRAERARSSCAHTCAPAPHPFLMRLCTHPTLQHALIEDTCTKEEEEQGVKRQRQMGLYAVAVHIHPASSPFLDAEAPPAAHAVMKAEGDDRGTGQQGGMLAVALLDNEGLGSEQEDLREETYQSVHTIQLTRPEAERLLGFRSKDTPQSAQQLSGVVFTSMQVHVHSREPVDVFWV
ncbi:hypothetical protein B0H10DRAFT_1951063 [Mycena sp. CBHHK59/15]|nr:hypothetical protein B0H10DRAFT_1951063 [Mycena sp. CBHHK59/15]